MKISLVVATFVGLFAISVVLLRSAAESQPIQLEPTFPDAILLSSVAAARPPAVDSLLLVASSSAAANSLELSEGNSVSGELKLAAIPTPSTRTTATSDEMTPAPIAGQAGVPAPMPSPTPTPIPTPAPLPTPTPSPALSVPPVSDWDAVFEKYAAVYGVDAWKLSVIAKCESGYRQDAVNGPYGGMYQYHANTWRSTRTAMGEDPNPELRFNGEEAIKTTAYKISQGGIGAWPHCGKL